MTASEQETVLIITAVDSDSQDETMSTDNGDKTVDRRKYFLWAVLSAALVLVLCAACVMISGGKFSGTPSGLTMRRPERLIQVSYATTHRAGQHHRAGVLWEALIWLVWMLMHHACMCAVAVHAS